MSELAKDLNVTSKELVEFLKEYFENPLKTTTTLTDSEVNFVLELCSQKNQVESFEKYFASSKQEKEEKARKTDIVTSGEENVKNSEEKVKVNKVNKVNIEKNNPTKKEKNENDGKEKNNKKEENNKKEKNLNDDVKKENVKVKQDEKFAVKPKEKTKKEAKSKQNVKEKAMKTIKIIPKKQNDSAKRIEKEKDRKFIETKSSHLNFEKYNERYEKIAGEEKVNDSFQNKQKIKKKFNQKNFKKKETEAQKLQRLALEKARQQKLKISIPDEIVVSELAVRLKVNVAQVIKQLIALGVMATVNETIDFDTACIVAQELGAKVEREINLTIEERLFEEEKEEEDQMVKRDPVVVVVGHVDHGKTSLLDKIRNTNIISSESGGITQHIGAYKVSLKDGKGVTFLDTPGHEAFTSMRMRGVNVTDIAILVVAADDGIMPQTVEAINHAKAAKVSIIVAINKIDKPQANVEKIKKELIEYGLVPEEWGGDVICVPVSAKTGEGINQLLEMIDLVAEVKELKAVENKFAKGSVVEAYLDKGRGPVATLLVQNGTLKLGDSIIAGVSFGRVRVMLNDKGEEVTCAGPSTPVEITGLSDVPYAGDVFNAVDNERLAKELVEQRKFNEKKKQFEANKVSLENIFSNIKEGEKKTVNLIIKADVQGSVEAMKTALEKLSNDEVKINIIHGGSGAINDADVKLAAVSNAIVIGFNVRPNAIVREFVQTKGVELRLYRVIYDAIEDVEKAMKGMLAPKEREVELGSAKVRQIYRISNVGTIAGCYVTSGKILRKANVRVVRDGVVVVEDSIKSLKRFKDDVKEVLKEFECGICLTNFNDIKVDDVLESFIIEEYKE